MTLFSYKATDSAGKIVTGSLDSNREDEVVSQLQAKGLIPIQILHGSKDSKKAGASFSAVFKSIFSRVSTKDAMLFTQDLSALLSAGVPIDRALSILTDVTENKAFQEIIEDVLKLVQGGSYLSDALAQYPQAFSDFYINMIRAGEAGGVMESVLDRLGVFLENSQDLKDFIGSALVYPIFLTVVGGISIIILMTYVIPKFSVIFDNLGSTIPFTTRLLLNTSEFMRYYWWLLLLLAAIWGLFIWRFKNSSAGRAVIDRYKMILPVIGGVVKKVEVARFSRTLGTLIKSGVPILQALELVKETIGNQIIARSIDLVHDRVKEGERLSKPLSDTGHFPALAIQMITVGEETGKLEEMLLRVADNYDKLVRTLMKRFVSLLEPALILAMGLMVGFIVISMLMAIFSMNQMPF